MERHSRACTLTYLLCLALHGDVYAASAHSPEVHALRSSGCALVDGTRSHPRRNHRISPPPQAGGAEQALWLGPCNDTYYQIFQYFPSTEVFYLEAEKDSEMVLTGWVFANSHPFVPVVIVLLYVACILGGRKFMEDRKAQDLRTVMGIWNMSLSAFSFVGAMRTVPLLLVRLTREPIESTLCADPVTSFGCGVTGLWLQIFIYSKIVELGDTFFLVARKRSVTFLHWYHHITVLVYCWYAYAYMTSQAHIFVAMNYAVHAVMYFYYGLMSFKLPSIIPPVVITASQIMQMVIGTLVQFRSLYLCIWPEPDLPCHVHYPSTVGGCVMYGSYLVLFLQYAVGRYLSGLLRLVFPAKAKES
eukprot:TRINITY_DN36070_c0_g1_i1.p1 TRINITY_DN36070_c0_g1~~TRINITY_DN36070_c0_g1_i1.p1  ORF type:complete len:359 (+),score=42.73 TRINITY_DN36070_c0_g1_i1:52-1128(+)